MNTMVEKIKGITDEYLSNFKRPGGIDYQQFERAFPSFYFTDWFADAVEKDEDKDKYMVWPTKEQLNGHQ